VLRLGDGGAEIRDEITGETATIRARVVVNAAGVWAGELVPDIALRPSRGTHLVLRGDCLPRTEVALMAPVPGEPNRFVFALPQPDGLFYVGLTDVPVDGPAPDVPEPTEPEIAFLLEVLGSILDRAPARADVVGAYAGLRPLLDAPGRTADLSRRHAVLTAGRVVTVVGGKLATYRRMAEDAVDAAVRAGAVRAGRCRTRRLPLVGARSPGRQAGAPARLVRRYGAEAGAVLENARTLLGVKDEELLAPVTAGVPTTTAELVWGVTHEGALDVDDLLDRRTRIGLVPVDRAAAHEAARAALEAVSATRR
jgi:glycerol-3-phosphate dehydrogenase